MTSSHMNSSYCWLAWRSPVKPCVTELTKIHMYFRAYAIILFSYHTHISLELGCVNVPNCNKCIVALISLQMDVKHWTEVYSHAKSQQDGKEKKSAPTEERCENGETVINDQYVKCSEFIHPGQSSGRRRERRWYRKHISRYWLLSLVFGTPGELLYSNKFYHI